MILAYQYTNIHTYLKIGQFTVVLFVILENSDSLTVYLDLIYLFIFVRVVFADVEF
jgi:hypothetical protein